MNKLKESRFLFVANWVNAASILARLDLDISIDNLSPAQGKLKLESVWRHDPEAEVVIAHSILETWGKEGLRDLVQFQGRALHIQVELEDLEKHSELLSWWVNIGFGLHLWLLRPLTDLEKEKLVCFYSDRIRIVYVHNLICPLPSPEQLTAEKAFIWFPPAPRDSYEFVKAREFYLWWLKNPALKDQLLFYRGLRGEPLSEHASLFFHDRASDPLGRTESTFCEWLLIKWLMRLRRFGPSWLYTFLFSILDFMTQAPSLQIRNLIFRLPVKVVRFVLR